MFKDTRISVAILLGTLPVEKFVVSLDNFVCFLFCLHTICLSSQMRTCDRPTEYLLKCSEMHFNCNQHPTLLSATTRLAKGLIREQCNCGNYCRFIYFMYYVSFLSFYRLSPHCLLFTIADLSCIFFNVVCISFCRYSSYYYSVHR